MKFYCDACNTKYAISDDKVLGKVLKVRCKNCGNIITVREAVAPVRGSGAETQTDPTIDTPTHIPLPGDVVVPTTQWYYALNGQTFGPFTLEGLRRKYATAEIGDATYVWHEKLGAWKPVAEEPAFADALALGHKIVPSRKTLGFTGPVEAIRVVHGGPSNQREGAVPNQTHARPQAKAQPAKPVEPVRPAFKSTPPAHPQAAVKPPAKPQSTPEPKRPTLTPAAKQAAPLPESTRRPDPKPVPTPEARPIKDARPGNLDRLRAKLSTLDPDDESAPPLPKPVGGEAIFTYAAGVVPASAESSQNIDTAIANDAVDFSLPPRAKPPKPSPSSTSDILERVIGPTSDPPSEVSEVDDSGVIPFFPEAPRLPSSIKGETGQEATSESLLIDVGQMRQEGRRRNAIMGGIAAAIVVIIGGVGITLAMRSGPKEALVPVVQQPKQKDDLVIPRYKKEEVAKIATLDLEDELLFSEEEAVVEEEVPPAEVEGGKESEPKPVKVAAIKKPKKVEPVEEPADVETAPPEKVDPLAALLAPRANRETIIRAPEDKLMGAPSEGLSKDQARRGFQRVKKSIRDCRERHNRYNAKLDAGKLKISVTVEPSGQVSEFTLNPRSVQNTEFANCMKSHQGRWTFAKFSGKAVVINTSVIIQ